jgi:hypothetical protein
MAGKPKGEANDKVMQLRLPSRLYASIVEAAEGHSVSEEIRERLEITLAPATGNPIFADVLQAVRRAADFAGRLPADDTVKYAVFADAARMLLTGFTPDEPPQISDANLGILGYQLIGAVLGTMDERGQPAWGRLMKIMDRLAAEGKEVRP